MVGMLYPVTHLLIDASVIISSYACQGFRVSRTRADCKKLGLSYTYLPAADKGLGKNGLVSDFRQIVVDVPAQFGRQVHERKATCFSHRDCGMVVHLVGAHFVGPDFLQRFLF